MSIRVPFWKAMSDYRRGYWIGWAIGVLGTLLGVLVALILLKGKA